MPLNVRRLRLWVAGAIALLVLVVAGFYLRGYYARYLLARTIREKTQKLGINIQQSADQFSLSKSEGGRTIFTIHASKAVQVTSGHAELHDVNIVVYGEQGNRFDQIYGKSFEYDPKTGMVRANGEVHIDLQGVANGEVRPDLGPPKELENPIHLKTTGLEFNRNTGIATTNEQIEFRVPQASGSAVGATYDSKAAKLTLHSEVHLQQSGEGGATLTAASGTITKDPQLIEFSNAHIARQTSDIEAERLTVYLREDNSIDKILGSGKVIATTHGKTDARAEAPLGEAFVDADNHIQKGILSGGVLIDSQGDQPMYGTAGRLLLDFVNNQLRVAHALDKVHLVQSPPKNHPQQQSMTLNAQAVDFKVMPGQSTANTVGPGQIVLSSAGEGAASSTVGSGGNKASDQSTTVVTADHLVANFDAKAHLQTLVGSPNAKVVSSMPGQPDKTTTSDVITVAMNPAGGVASIAQEGDFRYAEPPVKPGELGSTASATKATYDPQTQMFTLLGSPRITDNGSATTAEHIRVNRASGDAFAEGNVKTTYSQLQAQPNGALLSASDPIHVTSAKMIGHRDGTATYSGNARLWQGSNAVEAPTIDFDRDKRTVVAQGKPSQPVSTVFVQTNKDGKQTPVSVTGSRLTYTDSERQARFEGEVVVRSADATLTADRATAFLEAHGSTTPAAQASQLDKIVADGHVVVQQQDRRGTGNKLVYVTRDESFTLTGGPPSIFDAEHGKVTGVSLTFFSHDDRVLVEGGGKSAPSVTKARVIK
ncbi:MAG TPA: LptA/OstA family protein [Terriglobales bacterium]|nr:LptA/OstA family protein [Terriglobales bacterium]